LRHLYTESQIMASNQDNLSAVLLEKGNLKMEQRPIPKPGKNEVLIRIHSVGICGSDVHYWVNGCIGDFIVRGPMVLGHETSGVVAEVGSDVKNLKPGDRVAIEPGVPCRTCDYCKNGQYNLCPDIAFCATPPFDGTLARYFAHAADFCFKLPDHVSFEEGALLEPLSVAVQACRRANITLGDSVLICGAGPIGLVNLLTARAHGAAKICITDVDEHRLAVAKSLGADFTYQVSKKDVRTLAEEVATLFGQKPDKTIECSGAEPSIQLAIYATKSGGTIVLVGLGPAEVRLPIVNAAVREVDIRGVFRYANCYQVALAMVASGRINVKPLVTHRFKLEESLKAFETAKTGADHAIKVMIKCAAFDEK